MTMGALCAISARAGKIQSISKSHSSAKFHRVMPASKMAGCLPTSILKDLSKSEFKDQTFEEYEKSKILEYWNCDNSDKESVGRLK